MLYVENDPEGQVRAWAFRQGLEKLGWTAGRNFQIDYRWGVGDGDWIRSAAAELLMLAPDVILANGGPAARAVLQATRSVPAIFIGVADPVADGFVQSLARPGGNLTGFTTLEASVGAKLLELLKEVAPLITRVGVLINPNNPGSPRLSDSAASAAEKFGVDVVVLPVREDGEIELAMMRWGGEAGVGLIVPPDPTTNTSRRLIVELAARYRVPAIHTLRAAATDGAGGAVAWPVAARAQQAGQVPRIGVLMDFAADDPEGQARLTAFRQGLAELGLISDRNVRVEHRWAATDVDRVRRYAAELVALTPDLIVAGGATALRSLQQATGAVPIVFAGVTDPVGGGLVETRRAPAAIPPVLSTSNTASARSGWSCSSKSLRALHVWGLFETPLASAEERSSVLFRAWRRRRARHHHLEHRMPDAIHIAAIRHRFRKPPAHSELALRLSQQQQPSIRRLVAAGKINCRASCVERMEGQREAAYSRSWRLWRRADTRCNSPTPICYVNCPFLATAVFQFFTAMHNPG